MKPAKARSHLGFLISPWGFLTCRSSLDKPVRDGQMISWISGNDPAKPLKNQKHKDLKHICTEPPWMGSCLIHPSTVCPSLPRLTRGPATKRVMVLTGSRGRPDSDAFDHWRGVGAGHRPLLLVGRSVGCHFECVVLYSHVWSGFLRASSIPHICLRVRRPTGSHQSRSRCTRDLDASSCFHVSPLKMGFAWNFRAGVSLH